MPEGSPLGEPGVARETGPGARTVPDGCWSPSTAPSPWRRAHGRRSSSPPASTRRRSPTCSRRCRGRLRGGDVGLARGGRGGRRTAFVAITVELVGVLVVGTLSLTDRAAFPDETVWSGYGRGYGFIPLVLPVLGLLSSASRRPTPRAAT